MPSPVDNFFVVIEGLDGSGKTQISRRVTEVLRQTHNVALTFEPHDPSTAGFFIRQVLSKRIKTSSLALAYAFALNRIDHNNRIINPFLVKANKPILICDRYYLSSLVYQSVDPLTMADVRELNRWARRPDLTIFLNVSTKVSYERMRKRAQDKELFEKNQSQTHETYQQAMALLRKQGDTIVEVDADDDFPVVLDKVLTVLHEHGPDWLQIQRTFLDVGDAPFEWGSLDNPEQARADCVEKLTAQWNPPHSQETDEQVLKETIDHLQKTIEKHVQDCTYAEIGQYFLAFLKDWGYVLSEPVAWSDTVAYSLTYELPLGIRQTGIVVLLDKSQRLDAITRYLQSVIENLPQLDDLQQDTDFMFVLDAKHDNPLPSYYERGGGHTTDTTRLSPNVRIINRQELVKLLLVDVLATTLSYETFDKIAKHYDLPDFWEHHQPK